MAKFGIRLRVAARLGAVRQAELARGGVEFDRRGGPDVVIRFRGRLCDRDGGRGPCAVGGCLGGAVRGAAPVRRFASYRGQRHLPGLWWSATVGRHVGYESWLERDHVMALDFDPDRGRDRRRSRSGCPGPTRAGHGPVACAGLLRPPGGRLGGGGRLPAGRAAQAAGRRPRSRRPDGRASWSAGSTGWSARRIRS